MSVDHLNTKDVILQLLKTNNEMTVANLAEKLEITEMAVRRHLQNLENEGFVTSSLIRKSLGRPLSVYSLTEKGEDTFPKQYKDVLVDFVQFLEQKGQHELLLEYFENRFHTMYDVSLVDMENSSFSDILKYVAHIQNENGHMVEYELINDQTGEIKLSHCPLSQLSSHYPAICNCERDVLQNFFPQQEVEINCSLSKGDKSCTFLIRPN